MIQPTRTRLLQLREKNRSIQGSVRILRARRQALIREFLASTRPFLTSREKVKERYRQALDELHLSLGHEGEDAVASLASVSSREVGIEIENRNVLGVKYREISGEPSFVRTPEERDYDFHSSTVHLEESIHLFEVIVEAMMEVAVFESKLKRLGEEILLVTRRTRVLEERILPRLSRQIRTIAQYLGERERESYFRLKRFKEIRSAAEEGLP